MSVINFATHPCPVCKSDTLHIAMRCQDCGNQQVHPHEQFESRSEDKKPHAPKRSQTLRGIFPRKLRRAK